MKVINESKKDDDIIKQALSLDEPANTGDEDEENIEKNIDLINQAIDIQKKVVDKDKDDKGAYAVYLDLKDKLEKWSADESPPPSPPPQDEPPQDEDEDEEEDEEDKVDEKSRYEKRKEKRKEKQFKKKKEIRKRKNVNELKDILEENKEDLETKDNKNDLPKSEIFKLFNEEKDLQNIDPKEIKEIKISETEKNIPSKLSIFLNNL